MNPSPPATPESLLRRREQRIEDFEIARARTPNLNLADFLPPPDDSLYAELLAELIRVDLDWGHEQGAPRPLSHYLESFPRLKDNTSVLQGLAFEEYRLRRTRGENPSPSEYEKRFGVSTTHWPGPQEDASLDTPDVQSVARSYRLFCRQQEQDPSIAIQDWISRQSGPKEAAQLFADLHQQDRKEAEHLAEGLVQLPAVGTDFIGFELLGELGRGAFGRVYLARQAGLANRLVALKVSPDAGSESQTLAQLQHTHIVPIYSFHRTGSLHAVCMPYFGALTLADVLRDLSTRPTLPASGVDLLSSLQRRHDSSGRRANSGLHRPISAADDVPEPAATVPLATLKRLRGFSYVEAVLWLASCLAEGLAHAHDRGIVHRDLKPANVLVTDDGQPMLLDFNLSEDVKVRGNASAALVGGTLPYMAPEHLRAFRGDKTSTIDHRSDLFALGVIVYELLTGRYPFATRALPVDLYNVEPERRTDLLVQRMEQERRTLPPSVRQFNRAITPAVASILQRCLHPDPDRRYRSALDLHEDLECHLDGLPLKHAPDPSFVERMRKRIKRSPRLVGRVAAGTAFFLLIVAAVFGWQTHEFSQAEEARQEYRAFREERQSAQWLLNARMDDPDARREGLADAHSALAHYSVLERPDWQKQSRVAALPSDQREALVAEVAELLIYLARAQTDAEAALTMLDRAEKCFAPELTPPTLFLRRAEWLHRVSRNEEAAQFEERAAATTPQTALAFTLRARDLAHTGRYGEALRELDEALTREPRNYWANFLRGICFDGQGQPHMSANAYSTCIALEPDFYGAWFNRGLARMQQREYPLAAKDFDRVLALRPELADAYTNRGLSRLESGSYADANSDFTEALTRKPGETRLYFLRSRARSGLKDAEGARADFESGLKQTPANDKSWVSRGLARAKLPGAQRADFEQSIRDFDEALKLNPQSREALVNKISLLSNNLGQPTEALPLQDRLIARFPDVASYRSGRGVVRARMGLADGAREDAREAFARDQSAASKYQIACIHALLSRSPCTDPISELCLLGGLIPEVNALSNAVDVARRTQEQRVALDLLRKAVIGGFGADLLESDTDLDPLRPLPEFQQLLRAVRLLQTAPR